MNSQFVHYVYSHRNATELAFSSFSSVQFCRFAAYKLTHVLTRETSLPLENDV